MGEIMKKRALTLLEIMIVIMLITLISGTIGYSMKGSLEKGRAFRTQQGQEQLKDLLLICLSEGGKIEEIAQNPVAHLKALGLAKDPENLVKDGWKQPFEISVKQAKNDFTIKSKALDDYKNRQNKKSGPTETEENED